MNSNIDSHAHLSLIEVNEQDRVKHFFHSFLLLLSFPVFFSLIRVNRRLISRPSVTRMIH